MRTCLLPALFALLNLARAPLFAAEVSAWRSSLEPSEVVWREPSTNSLGSMPLGNGDLGVNLWVEPNGDLRFYLSKTDAWSENAQLLKLGRVRVRLSPNPFANGQAFEQRLRLAEGEIRITAGTGPQATTLRVWVDAHEPVVQLDVDSPTPCGLKADLEVWRTQRRELRGPERHPVYGLYESPTPVFSDPDVIAEAGPDVVAWYHRNERSLWADNLKLQGLDELTRTLPDPLRHRTFGGALFGEGLKHTAPTTLQSTEPRRQWRLGVTALTRQTETVDAWLEQLATLTQRCARASSEDRRSAHERWWAEFWQRSWIHVSGDADADRVTQGYALQRFLNACAGRGAQPIKFNGSIFTMDAWHEGQARDGDFRLWGGPYWFQNTRLPYWSMLAAGDFDLMTPLFRMYRDSLPLARFRTQRYYGHGGAFWPETMYFWGTYNDDNYGRVRTGKPDGLTDNTYIRYYWSGGLELLLLMLDHHEFTDDAAFLRETLLPVAVEVTRFFDEHWSRDALGKIRFSPAMALETYHVAVNPAPEIAGLRAVLPRLLNLPTNAVDEAQRARWRRTLADLPELPTGERQGQKVLTPAAEFSQKANSENPELYAIFPYRLFGVGRPELDLARRTFAARVHQATGGWQQDAIQAALLGLGDEAARMITENFSRKNPQCRFPAFWGPNFDWTPDQDHGGVAMTALQHMLLQSVDGKLHLLPAWPKRWNVSFKLHAAGETTIEAEFRDGKLLRHEVQPARRANDLVIPASAVVAPPDAAGYPSRAPDLDALPGFRNPPRGYGEVPFWWWTGDPLDVERLTWQLDKLHEKGISGVQVNYAHEDTPGWPTYAAEPPLFSDAWWKVWGRITQECRQRGMGIGLSTYTLDWPNATNLFRRIFYSKTELNALRLTPLPRQRIAGGQTATLEAPADVVVARAYAVKDQRLERGGIDLSAQLREGHLTWTAPAGEWEIWLLRAERLPNTLNPLLAGIGETVIRDFFQRFQDATPDRSAAGLNYFFNDELQIGAGSHVWNTDLAAEFERRKGYALADVLPALWQDLGPLTPKVRLDYADVRMALMEERYFQPIYNWHAGRGLIFACDSGGRGLSPDEFGDYFRATRWYTAPGHDTPGGVADLIKGKVSSSIANLYRRPRVWLEGYHSLGWGATPERMLFATRENYLYGCSLLNLHGLYYSTHGSFWEWAPPCHHWRMPYWDHMATFLKYFERLSYLMSQGSLVSDVAIVYPVAPFEAGLDGAKATSTAFDTARALFKAGINFEFIDADSLARAEVRDGRLRVTDSAYRVLIFPAMAAARWSSLETAHRFAQAGGHVLGIGTLPQASDRAGRNDPELDAKVAATFSPDHRLPSPAHAPALVLNAFTPDTRAANPVRSHHRKVGPRDVYLVMDAAKDSVVEFRAKGAAELWDPWTGTTKALRVVGETETGTRVEMPLESYEAQVVVFTPGQQQQNPPAAAVTQVRQRIALEGDWEFELQPTMDNRYGDFRLPATDAIIGPEARVFRHALEPAGSPEWQTPDLDDRSWERVTYGFGPQFWALGPLPAAELDDATAKELETRLTALTRVDPEQPIQVGNVTLRWRPYRFSWRQGLEGDPGHQGWHGLKENVTDHFLCLGKPAEGHNEIVYGPEPAGTRYYLWTSLTVPEATPARIVASAPAPGEPPHASAVLTPAAIFLHGGALTDPQARIQLRAGANPLLVRYDHAGRGYLVVRRDPPEASGAVVPLPARTPLSMRWFDDPSVLLFDPHAGTGPAEWFRFTAPPGLTSLRVTSKGRVTAWANGQAMRESGPGQFEPATALPRVASISLRVVPETGASGGAIFPEPIRLSCRAGLAPTGDWSQWGALECYSGGAWYRRNLTLTAEQAAGSLTLDLGKVVATAEVRVNGESVGIRVAPPWQVDLTGRVRAGENRLEVLAYNTLANHSVTIPTRYRGEANRPPSLASGLIGPVTLECAAVPSRADFHFDRTLSRPVLENYLSRAITMEGLLNGRGDLADNTRMLKDIGAKFVGRALCLWGGEGQLLENLARAREQLPRVLAADPDLILQACIFEIVTTQVDQVPVPAWAFAALGQPVESRNFRYADMLYPSGRFKDHWRPGQSVPDVSRPETQLWFYFLGASFIEVGCEAIHFGQTELMNGNDRGLEHYARVLELLRAHAAKQARRHLLLCDSHVPSGGLVREGRLLFDFHSFPLRIKEVPDRPQEAVLALGFSDGLYGRSKGGITPSGWACEHLPYLVEIDNWGVSKQPGQAGAGSIWIWGYDEITWFAHQSPAYRAQWLNYARDWVRKTDPNGYLQMPGSRTLVSPRDGMRWYHANRPSPATPNGLGDEEAIRALWATHPPGP